MSPDRSPTVPAPARATDWTMQAADTIESVVGSIRDKTAVPLETVARGLVYGILIAVMGLAAVILVTIAMVRGLMAIPNAETWMVDTGLGTFFTLIGLWLWRKRRPKSF